MMNRSVDRTELILMSSTSELDGGVGDKKNPKCGTLDNVAYTRTHNDMLKIAGPIKVRKTITRGRHF